MLSLSVGKNIGLMALARSAIAGFISRSRELGLIDAQVKALAIKTPDLETPIQNLSGGNQQKAVIARCVMDRPAVLLADEPSQGVDAGARFEIYKILREATRQGSSGSQDSWAPIPRSRRSGCVTRRRNSSPTWSRKKHARRLCFSIFCRAVLSNECARAKWSLPTT